MAAGEWDTRMPSFTAFVPISASADYYPAYSKPKTHIQLKISYSGINGRYWVMESGTVVPYTILSTAVNRDGSRTDTIQINLSDINYNSNQEWQHTNRLHIKGYSGAATINSIGISLKWKL